MTMTSELSSSSAPSSVCHLERKLKKPLMEKKRRARINQCLMELKSLLLQAAPHQRTKLEKADILEMTVQYLRKVNMNKHAMDANASRQQFTEGYSTCVGSVIQFLNSRPISLPPEQRLGMMNHLQNYYSDRMKLIPQGVPETNYPQLSVAIPPGRCSDLPTPPYGFRSPLDSAAESPSSNSSLSPGSSFGTPTPFTSSPQKPVSGHVWRPW